MGNARTGSSERDDAGLQIALSLSIFLAALNFFALSPFTPRIAADLHTSVPLVGQISTLMILTSAVFGLVIGPVSDHIGHRLPLLLGIVCVAANLVGLSLARSYTVMLALGLIGGLADALVFNIPFAIIGSRLRDRAQHQAISWTFASLSAAPILGVPILTLIGSQFGWRVALASAGGAAMVCAWFVARAVPPDNQRTGEPLSLARIAGSYLPLFHDRTMVRLLASVGLRSMCWLGAIAYLGAFITDELHLGGRAGGLVFTVSGVGNVIGSMLGGRIRFAPLTLIAGVACLGGAIAVGATFATDDRTVAIAGIVCASALSSLAGVMTGSLLAGRTRAGAGTTMVLNGTLINFGGAAGTAISGLLLRYHGFPGLAAGLPVFAVLAGALTLWPVASSRRQVVQPQS